jgi:hypothetical protein
VDFVKACIPAHLESLAGLIVAPCRQNNASANNMLILVPLDCIRLGVVQALKMGYALGLLGDGRAHADPIAVFGEACLQGVFGH